MSSVLVRLRVALEEAEFMDADKVRGFLLPDGFDHGDMALALLELDRLIKADQKRAAEIAGRAEIAMAVGTTPEDIVAAMNAGGSE